MKYIICFLMIFTLLLSTNLFSTDKANDKTKNETKKPVNTFAVFTLPDINEKQINFNFANKKVIMVNVWAAWCGPCRNELPEMVKLYNTYKNDLEIVGIVAEKENVAELVKELKIPWVQFWDKDGKFMKEHNIEAYPTTYILNSKLEIVDIFVGSRNYKEFEDAFKDARDGKIRDYELPGKRVEKSNPGNELFLKLEEIEKEIKGQFKENEYKEVEKKFQELMNKAGDALINGDVKSFKVSYVEALKYLKKSGVKDQTIDKLDKTYRELLDMSFDESLKKSLNEEFKNFDWKK